MNRRDALKNLTMSIGYTVAAPTIMSIFNSCTAKTESWKPLFLSNQEKHIVTHLVDIIIPKSDTPGALDVNVPQFLDLMYHDIEKKAKQDAFKNGATLFVEKFKTKFKQEAAEGTKEDFETLLETYFNLSPEASKKIIEQQKKNINKIPKDQVENYSIYKFLISVRYYTLFGYCTSETVGETVLAYDPVPGSYNGCISVEEVSKGRAWSL